MGDVHEAPRPRIATAHLAQHIGKPVCFVGRVVKIHPTGKLFVLSDGEGKHTTVELSEPVLLSTQKPRLKGGEAIYCCVPGNLLAKNEEISGVLEVVGRVTNQATIMCMSYVQFREDKSPFDLELYNEALKIIHDFPEYFPCGIERNN